MDRWGLARTVGAVALGIAMLLAGATLPAAADPPTFLRDTITDTAGVLSPADRAEVAAAQAELLASDQLQLWVAYVESFDGLSGPDWAQQTAQLSGFGGNDVLFAVAVGDRAYGYEVAEDLPVSDAELEQILAEDVEPVLRSADDDQGAWADAAVALANGLAAGGSDGSGTGSGGSALPWLVGGLLLIGGVGLVLWFLRRSKQRGRGAGDGTGAPTPAAELPIEQLRQQVAAALIEVDDSIRTSQEELGFAIAQFGEESTEQFTAALNQSRTDLTSAFALQREAQAAEGEPNERTLLTEVLAMCNAADERLDEQVESFDKLRDLERTIDTVLPGLAERVSALPGRADAAAVTIEGLAAQWPSPALAPLGRQLEQARERITFAEESVRVGREMLDGGDRTGAVARARAVEEAVGQASTLLEVVERSPATLEMTQRAVEALIVETQKDLAEAERLGLPPEVAGPHHFATDTLTWAQQSLASGHFDPTAIRRALENSDAALDTALEPLRAAAERRERATALLAGATDAARSSIQAANDFITTRRGAVGAEARTRLAEAQRRFDEATAETDPVTGLERMQAADALADQAYVLAQQDEAQARYAQQRGGAGSGSLNDMILGGILIDAMNRGSGGSWGGSYAPRGSSGSWGGGSAPRGGGRGPGSFGGSSTRARRSGGGRF